MPHNRSTRTPGYLFMAPRGLAIRQFGAVMYDSDGAMLWSGHEYGETPSFQVLNYLGEQHLLIWQGQFFGYGVGHGYNLLLNKHYEVVANFTTDSEGDSGPTLADFHEAQITTNNTALMVAYEFKKMDLTPYGGPESGWILDCIAQEANVTTSKAIWTWKSSQYIDPSECYTEVGSGGVDEGSAWDYFHINSLEKDQFGNYMVSSRHCSTIYYLDGNDGHIIWKLGGRQSSFQMGENTHFSYQHDPRWVALTETSGTLSLFNNAGMFGVADESSSRGMILKLDFVAMTANLEREYRPFLPVISESQGSMQVYDNGNVLVGWGAIPYFSEYTPDGEMLWAAQFGVDTNCSGYRVLRSNWTGLPNTKPSVELVLGKSSMLSVYASWNGATEINKWELLGASDAQGTKAVSLYNRTRSGFETTISIPTNIEKYDDYTYFAMRAVDKNNQPLGRSDFIQLQNKTDSGSGGSSSSSDSSDSGDNKQNSASSMSITLNGLGLLLLSAFLLCF
ncbi:hypothetical protein V5O48_009827 [Marasmius crinis-equi]|uniref:ASST-domain-containing protein n=1 Tax=Marasmius crinis-equi TaxID=585013 RepID=A0ABR3FA25_9AGAR